MATFTVDKTHSHVEFSVKHMMISKVRGGFGDFDATVIVDDATNLPTELDATIDVASIDTKTADRDTHLKSADFFDATTYPTITFKSTSITGTPDAFNVAGDLTIHGVTKPVTLRGTFEGRGKDPWGGERVAYEAKGRINREDFGLTWNAALETGGVLVGKEIDIDLAIEAVVAKQPATA